MPENNDTTPTLFSSLENYVNNRKGTRVLRKVLIANNGIGAVKCIRSIRSWAYQVFGNEKTIEFLAMATPEDLKANAEYIRMADQFEKVPGGSNNNNYANVSLIIEIAERNKCDAIWAGWGHASENPKLPAACVKSGITFIGPNAHAMNELGDKINSTILAQSVDVSVVPWSGTGVTIDYEKEKTIPKELMRKCMVTTYEEASNAAEKVGFPLMIKASEGGGGKGIRKVISKDQLKRNFESVQGEVPGSPIFLMKLVTNCHHLEVQVLGDDYGNAISIYGRDCSVQRRHQKIIEEGPAIAADPTVWKKMEKAAVRLAQAVKYSGAGTVEYLYANGEYYFLELNPRLQVEHPVSERISNINLPAAQLNVAMGISLSNIPHIRRMYGLELYGNSEIDFDNDEQIPPKGHCIACRITAENPDEGFKPSSGNIKELTFRSTPNVWGYFSIKSKGSLHEFADSQFGHLFAYGETRNDARKNMIIVLKEITIRGDIRTPVEYLINLLETDDFSNNNIHTGWLDILLENSNQFNKNEDNNNNNNSFIEVLCGAAYRAFNYFKERHSLYMTTIERGQVPPKELLQNRDSFELLYNDIKYKFISRKFGDNKFFLSLKNKENNEVEVEISLLNDNGLLIVINGSSNLVYGKEEPQGLRLTIKGKTCIFPKEYDPSNLTSTTAGKLVRYLVNDGSFLKPGTPYAEIEVMKMYMPLIATESGTIHFKLAIGSVLIGGETIATLELENPNSIKKSTLFDNDLPLFSTPYALKTKCNHKLHEIIENLNAILNGYQSNSIVNNVKELIKLTSNPNVPFHEFIDILSTIGTRLPNHIENLLLKIIETYEIQLNNNNNDITNDLIFPSKAILNVISNYEKELDNDEKIMFSNLISPIKELSIKYINGYLKDIVSQFLDKYLTVELLFQQRERDDVYTQLRHDYKDDLEKIYDISLSRNENSQKSELIAIILDLIVKNDIESYVDKLQEYATLSVKDCIEVCVKARQLLIKYQLPSFKQRQAGIEELLRTAIKLPENRLEKISSLLDQSSAIFDVLTSFFDHPNVKVKHLAMEVYIRRCYRTYTIHDIRYKDNNDIVRLEWDFRSPNHDNDNNDSSPLLNNKNTLNNDNDNNELSQNTKSNDNIFRVESIDNLLNANNDSNLDISRYGLMVVLDSIEHIYDQFDTIIKVFKPEITNIQSEPINVLNISILNHGKDEIKQNLIFKLANFFGNNSTALRDVGLRRITIVFSRDSYFPEYFTFRERLNYQEDTVCRHVEPPLAYHLEINRLSNYNITYIPTLNRQVHLYYATAKDTKSSDPNFSSRFFVRAVVRSGAEAMSSTSGLKDYLISQAERVLLDAIKSLEVAVRNKKYSSAQNHHIFLKVITEVAYEPDNVDKLLRTLGETYGRRLWKLRVGKLELSGKVKQGNSVTPLRFIVTNPTGYDFEVEGYVEVKDNKSNTTFLSSFMGKPLQDQKLVNEPYSLPDAIQRKRFMAQNHRTTYCYDIPALYKVAVQNQWELYQTTMKKHGKFIPIPRKLIESIELIIENDRLIESNRPDGQNNIGMVAWKLKLFTPEAPNGREVILISNDITVQIGSFGPLEDILFMEASKLARKEGIPRIYIACNSGARIGLAQEVKYNFDVKWKDNNDPTKGFEYLYLNDNEFKKLSDKSVKCLNSDNRITDIIGLEDGLGVENLSGSGMIAGETSRAYEDIFTITHVTGRTVGIGAYLVRLGQRTVQTEAPIILTGASAINKLLGKEVYSSNSQLGGLQVMFRNGVSHLDVIDDFKGTLAIVKWLSYIPLSNKLQGPILSINDPIDREIEFTPTKLPYNTKDMLQGVYSSNSGEWISGFFDKDSFMETLAGWAKTVICGRARLGGIPVGVIAVETRTVENIIPADPANPESQEQVQMQAGQVWFPDSAYKTAQAISDFNYGEGLPLIIFANWRGFSGGMRDMYNEILKYGSYIVDNLRKYNHPVIIYIPPFGELRGGAWVVLDPTINPEKMEMYCDQNGRGGVLEPSGTVEIKFRTRDIHATMHRLDSQLLQLQKQLNDEKDDNQREILTAKIASREQELYPIYQQIAIQFAELHDTPGRMKAKNVIRSVVEWKTSRSYFYHRLKRLLAEEQLRKIIKEHQPLLSHQQQTEILIKSSDSAWESDKEFTKWSENPESLNEHLKQLRTEYIKIQLSALYNLDSSIVEDALKELRN